MWPIIGRQKDRVVDKKVPVSFTFCALPSQRRPSLQAHLELWKERVDRMLWMVISRLNNDHGGLLTVILISLHSLRLSSGEGYFDPEVELKTAHGKEAKRIILRFKGIDSLNWCLPESNSWLSIPCGDSNLPESRLTAGMELAGWLLIRARPGSQHYIAADCW